MTGRPQRFTLDPYDIWLELPPDIQEHIPAPASNSYSRMVTSVESAQQLRAMVAILGGQERAGATEAAVHLLVDPETNEAVLTSVDSHFDTDNPGAVWVYLPTLYRMINGQDKPLKEA